MSYILDALKKIEHEKNKKPTPDGRVSIAGDLFQERQPPPVRAGIWKVALLIVIASLVTAGGTWLLLRGDGKMKTADIRPSLPPTVPVTSPVVIPPAPVPVPVQPAPVQPAPVAAPPAAISPPAAVIQNKVETAEDDEDTPRAVRRTYKRASPRSVVTKQTVQAVQAAQTIQAPADIKLSGIAWQDERAGRRAVINGFLLREGAVVSGAKITDIYSNRVRFLSAAGQFEIKLDALLPAEVKK